MQYRALLILGLMAVLSVIGVGQGGPAGVVYTLTNGAASNDVLIYARSSGGTLTLTGAVSTGGRGTGGGLGNQGGLVLTENGRFLLGVNAGSDTVSIFRVQGDALRLTDVASSGGRRPISIAVSGELVYVLNAGGSAGGADNISGFRLNRAGKLSPIPSSTRPLSATMTDPAQVSFDRTGELLVVTEKATNRIDVFTLNRNGSPQSVNSFAAAADTPFGFAIGKRNVLVVSNARGGAAGASAVTAYNLRSDGTAELVGDVINTGETAVCWVAITQDGKLAFVTNTGSNTISSLAISTSGVTLIEAIAARTGGGPIDLAITNDDRFAVVLNSGSNTLQSFAIAADGKLSLVSEVAAVAGANGVAAK